MWLVSLFAIVLSFIRISVGDSTTNLFIFPTAPGPNRNYVADLSWTLGSTQEIQWTTTIDSYNIALYQQNISQDSGQQIETIIVVDSNGSGQQYLNWQVQTYDSDLSFSPVYFLWLQSENPDNPQNFTSHYFNITGRVQSSSSLSSSTAFTSSTSSTTSTIASSTLSTQQTNSDTSPISSAPSSPTPTSPGTASPSTASPSTASPSTASPGTASPGTASPAGDSSSTATIKVGLGVGLGIGLPLVLIAGIWIGLKLVQQRKSSSRGTSSDVPLAQFPNNKYQPGSYTPPNEAIYYGNQIHEAPGRSNDRHEAPGERDLIELGS